jgi:hypothetical protein
MAVSFWYDQPEAWDTLLLSGARVPGLARVEAKVGRRLDVRKPRGASGARLIDEGYDPAQVSITIQVWEKAHLGPLQSLVAQLRPKRAGDPTAYSVGHPQLQFLGIAAIYIKEISTLRPAGSGIYEVSIQGIEFVPLPPKGTGGAKKVGPDFREHDTPSVGNLPSVKRRPAPPSAKPGAVNP